MAAKTFDEVRSSLSAEEQALLDKTLKANPELKDGWMRQDDYSRKMTELQADRDSHKKDLEYAEQMSTWAETNVPRWDALVEKGYIDKETGEEKFSSMKADLERQLQEAQNSLGGDMDPKELDRRVNEIVKNAGVNLTKEEMSALIKQETKTMAEELVENGFKARTEEFNTKTIPYVAGFATGMAMAALEYQTETGEKFTKDKQKEIYAHMEKTGEFDPEKAMETYLKPVRDKKASDAEVNKRVEAELAKRRMPGGGSEQYLPNESDRGNIQKMMESQGDKTDFEATIMSKAREAAQEMRNEGKA